MLLCDYLHDYPLDIRKLIYNYLCINDLVKFNISLCNHELKNDLFDLIKDTTLLSITMKIQIKNHTKQGNISTCYLILENKQIQIILCKKIISIYSSLVKITILNNKLILLIPLKLDIIKFKSQHLLIRKILLSTCKETAKKYINNVMLFITMKENDIPSIKKLLIKNVDLNSVFKIEYENNKLLSIVTSYESVLYAAISNKNMLMCKILLKYGANPNINGICGKIDNNYDAYFTPLGRAITTDKLLTDILLKYGANPNTLTTENNSISSYTTFNCAVNIIDIAAGHRNFIGIALLLKANANIRSNNNYNKPHNIFNFCGKYTTDDINKLIHLNADINYINNNDCNILEHIIRKSCYRTDYAITLINAKINIHRINKNGQNILFELCNHHGDYHIDIVRALINNNIDINVIDNDGNTPLWIAAINNHVQITLLLIESGADLKIKNKEGTSLIDYIINKQKLNCCNNLNEMLDLLKNYNSDTVGFSRKCVICLTNDTNILYFPCLHLATCYMCNIKMKHYCSLCPICKIQIAKHEQIKNI